MPELPAAAAAYGDIYSPRITSPRDATGGCDTVHPIFGVCVRAPHTDHRHHAQWPGFEAAWTTGRTTPQPITPWGLGWLGQ